MAESSNLKSPMPAATAIPFRSNADVTKPGPVAELHPAKDLANYLCEYAREKPAVAGLWCFGIGFVLGWKLKIW